MSGKFEVLVMMLIVFGSVWCFDYNKCYLLSEFTLDCSSAKYKTNDLKAEINSVLNTSIRNLDLSNNDFDNIEIQTDPTVLVKLNLSRNLIKSVLDTDFENATNLKTLDLSYNRIEEISDVTFKFIRNLTVLNLTSNLLHSFSANLRHLISLSLDDNRLQSISATFHPALETLNLAKNSFSGYLQLNYPNLTTIILDGNLNLSSISFTNSANIEFVSINRIKSLNDFGFLDLKSLRTLSMKDCNLSRFEGILTKLMWQLDDFDLRNNSFVCSNRSVIGMLQKAIRRFPINSDLKCSNPTALKGKTILRLFIMSNLVRNGHHLVIAMPTLIGFMILVILLTVGILFGFRIPCRRYRSKSRYQMLEKTIIPDRFDIYLHSSNGLVDVYV